MLTTLRDQRIALGRLAMPQSLQRQTIPRRRVGPSEASCDDSITLTPSVWPLAWWFRWEPKLGVRAHVPPDRLWFRLSVTVALTLLNLFLIACGDAPSTAAAPTPTLAADIVQFTPTPTAAENNAASNVERSTPAPYRTPTPSISLEQLEEFGQSYWDGVDYTCAARGNTGACITFDAAYSTYIFFMVNNVTKAGLSFSVTPNQKDVLSELMGRAPDPPEDFVEFCTYSDYERWWLSAYSNCKEELLPGGEGLAALSSLLKEKWPELMGEIR